MITNFEEITHELNAEELHLAELLIKSFKARTKVNPVTDKEIVEGVNRTYNLKTKFNDARLRKIVNYYRTHSIIPLLSCKYGYYVSYDKDEIRSNITSLTQRATSILDCVYGLERLIKNESKNV